MALSIHPLLKQHYIIDFFIPTDETRSYRATGFAMDEVIAYATHVSSFVTTTVCVCVRI